MYCIKNDIGRTVLYCLLAWLLMLSSGFALAGTASGDVTKSGSEQESLQVVATFSILADMVKQLGGDYVQVATLVDWDEDAHIFQPSPNDVKQVATADLLFLNGSGFEGWLSRLLVTANFKGVAVEATEGVALIRVDLRNARLGQQLRQTSSLSAVYDPHAWHSLKSARQYAQNITRALIEARPAFRNAFLGYQETFLKELERLDQDFSQALKAVPEAKRSLVVQHNAFAYLARDYQVRIHSLQGMSSDSEVSAADIVYLIRLIKALGIQAIFTETTADERLIRMIESETTAQIEGALISGALSRKLAPTYLEMMRYNMDLIVNALKK